MRSSFNVIFYYYIACFTTVILQCHIYICSSKVKLLTTILVSKFQLKNKFINDDASMIIII